MGGGVRPEPLGSVAFLRVRGEEGPGALMGGMVIDSLWSVCFRWLIGAKKPGRLSARFGGAVTEDGSLIL